MQLREDQNYILVEVVADHFGDTDVAISTVDHK